MKKRILITGANGQLGSALKSVQADFNSFEISGIDIADLDLTNENEVIRFFNNHEFHYVINCAAFAAVDQCEKLIETAYAVNAAVPALLNTVCSNRNIRMIHISTDYIYDGNLSLPHVEEETLLPLSVYGKSKLEGEKSLWGNNHTIILRTSWLYGEFGNNFLRTVLRLASERKEIGMVFDQIGTPTYSGDFAYAILKIIEISENSGFIPGIYNYSNEGVCSWYDFAKEIIQLSNLDCTVKPIRTHEYPLPAKRPAYSVLDKRKFKQTFGLPIPYWKDSLIRALNNMEKKIL